MHCSYPGGTPNHDLAPAHKSRMGTLSSPPQVPYVFSSPLLASRRSSDAWVSVRKHLETPLHLLRPQLDCRTAYHARLGVGNVTGRWTVEREEGGAARWCW